MFDMKNQTYPMAFNANRAFRPNSYFDLSANRNKLQLL